MTAKGQSATDERFIVQHYGAAERIPDNIVDLTFDNQGLLWICPEQDNIRIFDGRHLRILETSLAAGAPRWEYSRILKDATGRLYFFSEEQDFRYSIDSTGQLSQDASTRNTASAWPFNNGYAYFDWDRFMQNGRNKADRADRRSLRTQFSTDKTFYAFNDSTFIFRLRDSLFVFYHGRHWLLPAGSTAHPNALLLNDCLFVFGVKGVSRLTEPAGRLEPVTLGGDILKDSLYQTAGSNLPITVYLSANPHIACHQRLYRLRFRDPGHLETILVGDLSAIPGRIIKVDYNPRQDITAIATLHNGIFLLRPNPFFPTHFDDRFLALKRKQIYYPLLLKAKDTFFTGWAEFTCRGYYRVIDLAHTGAKFLFKDPKGLIWEGNRLSLFRYDTNGSNPTAMAVPPPSNRVADMCADENGRLFALTNRSLLEFKEGALRDLNPSGFPTVRGLGEMKYVGSGIIWFGTSNGLFSYNGNTNRIERLQEVPQVPVLNITKLSTGGILFTCYDEPYYFYWKKGHFYKIPVETGLALNEIGSVIEDRHGRIWLATSSGFFVTTPEEIEAFCAGDSRNIYYYKYGQEEGLRDLEFNGGLNPSNGMSPDGFLLFNSTGGLTIFHQDSVKELFPYGDIGLTKKGRTVEEFTVRDSILLPHDNDGMQLQVRVPYYGGKDNLQVEYRLTPTTNAWQPVGDQGRILFNHLDHGVHHLTIRTRTGLRPTDFVNRTVTVTVRSMFYEEPVFQWLAAAAILAICIAVTLHIVRLRREVRQKNISLHDQNLRLQQTLGQLQDNISMKEKLISIILHDLKTPLYFQSLLFNKINVSDYFTNAEARRLFHELKNSSTAILQFTKEFLTWYSSQRDGFAVRPALFAHRVVVDDLFAVYKDIASKKNLTLGYACKEVEDLFTDRTILEIVLRNLLDNAIKYTEAGEVTVSFEKQANGIAIVVTDTGRGMTPEKIRELHSYFHDSPQGSSPTFGYRFIYTLAEKIGATIHITSVPGAGTSVTVIIPDVPAAARVV
ncbi:MAG TPA: HAMP domain-containing sensor histidine kinase [Puia sp.]|uniref:sensor histidine kinase n=1 Tax=Puia sp. TaxID=2045100 RepID=UPI002BDE0B73|nr:HAMP domain-containing sensor histidine kinase [Puia sp.]HVU96395.1 HAMP domain-containing sensor histidine kinase [Puia sp.]